MRILNRPMFKYGGPIKQGIMHGMKNGGNVGAFNVGSPVKGMFPKDATGREHHLGPGAFLLPSIYAAGRALARPFGSWAMKQIPKFQRLKYRPSTYGQRGGWEKIASKNMPKMDAGYKFNPNWLGQQFQKDPLYKTVAGGTSMFGKGVKWGGKKALGAGKYAFGSPSGLAFMGIPVTIMGTKWLLSDGTELNEEQKRQVKQEGPPGGGDPGMMGTGEWFAAEQAEKDKNKAAKMAEEAKAARKAKLEKYLDTMGYDKAKKGALGDALIDASAIVQAGTEEGGSLKHADWGKMINQAIQTTSKRLDKPEQIREAVGLMMTKADIEKDMNADDKALARVLTERRIDVLDKQLKGETLEDSINVAFQKTGNFPTGTTLAGIARTKGLDIETVIDSKSINDFLKKNPKSDAMDFMVENIKTAKKEGVGIPPGNYVVKNRIIAVDTEGNLTEVL